MNEHLTRPFAAISRELDADLTLLTGHDHDHMVALQAILNAVTTRLYQYLQEDTQRLDVTRVVGLSYSDDNVYLLINVSPTVPPLRPKQRKVPVHIRHGLSVRDVIRHLMFTHTDHRTLRPAFTQQLGTNNAVTTLLNLSHPDSELDALLRVIVTDTTDTIDLMISTGLDAAEACRQVLLSRSEGQPLVFRDGERTVTVQAGPSVTA